MSRRRSSRSNDSSIAASQRRLRKGKAWLSRFFARSLGTGSVGLRYDLESLEKRTLMTTVTSPNAAGVLYFLAGNTQVTAIEYSDVTFEAVGAMVNATTGVMTLGDLAIDAPGATVGNPTVGTNIYQLYVTQSTAQSYISIFTVSVATSGGSVNITALPYEGAITAFQTTNTQTGMLRSSAFPSGTGQVFIGALDPTANPGPVPISTGFLPAPLGIDPNSGLITPGIIVAPINAATGAPNNFGNFLVAGGVSGAVSFGASVNEFYAGDVLTGDIGGDFLNGGSAARPVPNNFFVAGDLRDFLTTGPVGTDNSGKADTPLYITNFDLNVGGKLGEFKVGNAEAGGAANFAGTIEVGNSNLISQQTAYPNSSVANLIGFTGDQLETEKIQEGIPSTFDFGLLDLRNDTPADAQIIGSSPVLTAAGVPSRDSDGNIIYQSSVDGEFDNTTAADAPDQADYYGVPLLAGQTVQVALDSSFVGLQIIDPDGRVIGSNSKSGVGFQQFTTDRPGLYLFEVTAVFTDEDVLYNLDVTGVGQMAIGGIVVQGNITDTGIDQGIQSGGGDIGVIHASGTYASTTLGPAEVNVGQAMAPSSIVVASGNLRAVTATSIGLGQNASGGVGVTFSDPLYLSVPDGSVGLLDATGTDVTDLLAIECQFDPNLFPDVLRNFKTDDRFATAIGGSIQVLNSGSTFFGELATNGGIGTIRAARTDTTDPTYIDVNADNKGFDGIIDLIDVTGQFGVLGEGGPQIVTNTGGNVRYMDIGGPAFLPVSFGGEEIFPSVYPAGASATFTDDSGADYTVTANGVFTTLTVTNLSTGITTNSLFGPQFGVSLYPVIDKAGEIPFDITSTGSLSIKASGTNPTISSVDIGALSFTGIGRQIVSASAQQNSSGSTTAITDAYGNINIVQPIPTGGQGITSDTITDTTDEFLSLSGTANINVLSITAVTNPLFPLNSPVEIANTTKGEVVSVKSFGVGTLLVDGNLGFGTGTAVDMPIMPSSDINDGNTYPFVQQHTGVVLGTGFVQSDQSPSRDGTTGDAVSIQVGGAAGNINAGGTIGSIQVGLSPITGQYNGIVGPILAARLLAVGDGQGILPTGTGLVGFSGLFATGKIGAVTGSGDIRGDIISSDNDISATGIDSVSLTNASIIDCLFETVADFVGDIPSFIFASDLSPIVTVIQSKNDEFAPGAGTYFYDIGPIRVTGNGGIIGIEVASGSVASLTVAGGFGIIDATIDGQHDGGLGSVTASGYGIRESRFTGFGYIGAVAATGNGSLVPVTTWGLDVRPSDVPDTIDPFFGRAPDALFDLNADLSTSRATPNIANVTDTGVIEDSIFAGAIDFASLTAYKARTAQPVFNISASTLGSAPYIPVIGQQFSNSITFGGTVGSITIKQVVDGFQITAGKVGKLSLGNSVNRFGISVAGNLGTLVIHGNLGQYITDPGSGTLIPDSYLNAGGANGTITSLKIYGNLNADVSATGSIGTILVTGYVLGSITANAMTSGLALTSLRVMGGLRNGALTLKGDVGSIIVNGGLGTSTGTLEITGNAKLIEVGADRNVHVNALALGLTVDGTLSKLLVYGSITGTVHTLGDLTNLTVFGGGSSIITGNINVDGRIGTATINNGDIASSIIANGSITNFTLNRGSVLANSTVESQIDGIFKFKIAGGTNYGLFGSLLAQSGQNDNIDISGNIGDGTDAAVVTALSGNNFHVRGAIRNHSTITVAGELNVLQVDKGIEAGATITALEIKKRKISGTNNGTIVTTIT